MIGNKPGGKGATCYQFAIMLRALTQFVHKNFALMFLPPFYYVRVVVQHPTSTGIYLERISKRLGQPNELLHLIWIAARLRNYLTWSTDYRC